MCRISDGNIIVAGEFNKLIKIFTPSSTAVSKEVW